MFARKYALCLVFLLASLGSAQSPTDINGVRLGMSVAEVKQKLGPQYDFYPAATFKDPAMVLLMAGSNKTSETQDAWLLGFIDGKAVYLAHHHRFAPNQLPDVEVTKSRAVAKYGEKTTDRSEPNMVGIGSRHRYVYKPDGGVYPYTSQLEGCAAGSSKGDFRVPVQSRYTQPAKLQLLFLVPDEVCPVALEVEVIHTNEHTAQETRATLVDNPSMRAESIRFSKLERAQAQSDHDKLVQRSKQSANPF